MKGFGETMIDYDKILRLMKYKKITIKELAERINVPYKTLLYNFNHKDMKVRLLLVVCNVLDINIKDILL